MARRQVATYLTNAHTGRCLLCGGEIVPGQGAVVRQDGKGANHSSAKECAQ